MFYVCSLPFFLLLCAKWVLLNVFTTALIHSKQQVCVSSTDCNDSFIYHHPKRLSWWHQKMIMTNLQVWPSLRSSRLSKTQRDLMRKTDWTIWQSEWSTQPIKLKNTGSIFISLNGTRFQQAAQWIQKRERMAFKADPSAGKYRTMARKRRMETELFGIGIDVDLSSYVWSPTEENEGKT